MRILFWGTPAYAVPSLDALVAAGHRMVGVVSQPDRRRSRGRELLPSPVKARALELGLPVFTPQRIRREPDLQQQLAQLEADVSVVVAFGQILPPEVLAQPRLGCWNAHGSLLPRWRGAAPIQWCLIEGDPETGVGIMAMEEGLDTGPVLIERRVPIGLLDNAEQLRTRLAALSAELLVEAMPALEVAGAGSEAERLRRLGVHPQSDQGICYARLLTKQDQLIDWNRSALAIHRRVMGLYPGAHTHWRGKRLKLLRCEPLVHRLSAQLSSEAVQIMERCSLSAESSGRKGGEVLALEAGVGLVVATAGCPLLVREVQLEGRKPVGGTQLLQQLGCVEGDQLG